MSSGNVRIPNPLSGLEDLSLDLQGAIGIAGCLDLRLCFFYMFAFCSHFVPQIMGPLGPHTTPIRIPKDMGIVWEAYLESPLISRLSRGFAIRENCGTAGPNTSLMIH